MIPVTASAGEALLLRRLFTASVTTVMMLGMRPTRGLAAAGAAGRTRRGARAGAIGLVAALALGAGCSTGSGGGGRERTQARAAPGGAARPNLVWIVADSAVASSAIERLGGAATTISEAAAVASGSASVRAALLTGVSPSALGLEETSGRFAAPPPAGLTVLPEQLRRAGYYTSRAGPPGHDLAFRQPDPVDIVHVDGGVHEAARALPVPVAVLAQPGLLGAWDAAGPDADWRGREKDWESPCTVAFGCGGARTPGARPFFALFNVDAGRAGREHALEERVARVVEALAADGRLEDTVVFLIGAGGRTPTVAIRWPAGVAGASEPDAPVGLLDLAPTALALAGVPAPEYMEGRALVGTDGNVTPAPVRAVAQDMATSTDRGSVPLTPNGVPVAATPGGYPTGGLFHVAPRVELWCDTEGSTIVYTTEHEAPFYWRLYTGPFRMRFWTLRFQCGRLGYRDSDIVTFDFDIE